MLVRWESAGAGSTPTLRTIECTDQQAIAVRLCRLCARSKTEIDRPVYPSAICPIVDNRARGTLAIG